LEDNKRKDFMVSVAFTEVQICSPKFIQDFALTSKTTELLAEFATAAEGRNA